MSYRSLLEKGWAWPALPLLGAAAALSAFLPRLRVDAGTNILLNEDDPDLAFYNATRPEWGYDEYAVVCARRSDWFTPDSQKILGGLAEALRSRVPHVRSVTSIRTVPLLRNRPPLMGLPVPVTLDRPGVDLEKAREELLEHTLARGNLISRDGKDVALLVHLDVPPEILRLDPEWSAAQARRDRARLRALEPEYEAALALLKERRTAMVEALRKVAEEWSPRMDEPLRISGLPVINVNMVEHVAADLRAFGAAGLVFFLLALAAIYRRPRWILLPVLTALLPVVLVTGGAAAAGRRLTVVTSNAPILLFALVLPYAVYFVERYRERRRRLPGESSLDSCAGAAAEIWIPCLYSAATTIAGFASLLTSGIQPVRTFGLMMAAGMAAGLASAFLFLPAAVRTLRPLPPEGPGGDAVPRGIVRILAGAVRRAPGAVAILGALILAASVWGISRLRVETKFIDYFPPASEIYRGLEHIDTRLGGTTPLEILLFSHRPGFFKSEEGLAALEAASAYFAGVEEAGSVRSLKTLLDEARKAFPHLTVDQLAAVLKGFRAEHQIREFVGADFSTARILVRFRETAPGLHRNNILRGLRAHLEARPELRGLDPRPTGVFLLYANMLNTLWRSQRDTFLLVAAVIGAMLVLLFRSLPLALLVLLPQVLPVLACLGLMGGAGIPLDLVTVMIASIALGVGIDAAIQYAVRFRQELEAAGGDRRSAVDRTHATTGRAIWIATSIVVAGFAVLCLSRFVPTATFGLLTALAMLMGQFAALTLLPSLFLLTGHPRAGIPAPDPPSSSR